MRSDSVSVIWAAEASWLDPVVDLKAVPGSTITLRIENQPHGKWFNEAMFLTKLQISDEASTSAR